MDHQRQTTGFLLLSIQLQIELSAQLELRFEGREVGQEASTVRGGVSCG